MMIADRPVAGRRLSDRRRPRLLYAPDAVSTAGQKLLTSPGEREERLDQDLEQLRIRGLARGVTVAFGSIKGGVGKTTLMLSLADTFADALRCGVLVVDADLEWGTAADSIPQDGRRGGTLTDVLQAQERIYSPGDLAPYLVGLPGGAQLLAGPTDPDQIERIEIEDMERLLDLLQRFFPVILLDLSPRDRAARNDPALGVRERRRDRRDRDADPRQPPARRQDADIPRRASARVPLTLALYMVPKRPEEAIRRVIEVAERAPAQDGDAGDTRRYAAIPRDDGLMRQLDTGLLDVAALDQPTRIAIKDLGYQLASGWCR